MIKDIEDPKVENIGLAAVPEKEENSDEVQWYIYLINLTDVALENVIVASRGYGHVADEKLETSQLRHHIAELPPKSFVKVEPIMEALFGLTNQYWLSFFLGKRLYDKKYIFLAESIGEKHLTDLPLMNRRGVLIL